MYGYYMLYIKDICILFIVYWELYLNKERNL